MNYSILLTSLLDKVDLEDFRDNRVAENLLISLTIAKMPENKKKIDLYLNSKKFFWLFIIFLLI